MATATRGSFGKLEEILGEDARGLLDHKCQTVPKSQLHLPGPDFVDSVWKDSDRPTRVLRSMQSLFDHGRLSGTGYLSILPVDQGIEHTAGASFAPNPIYFDGEKIIELAIEGGCNAVASTFGVLGSVARRYARSCVGCPLLISTAFRLGPARDLPRRKNAHSKKRRQDRPKFFSPLSPSTSFSSTRTPYRQR